MELIVVFLFVPFFSVTVAACDDEGLAALDRKLSITSFYIFATVEVTNQSFDLKTFFGVLQFSNLTEFRFL